MTFDGSTLTVTGSAVITGRLTAQEFYTEFVSASIIYESGSTKFGDTLDDTHKFTGSLSITGSLITPSSSLPASATVGSIAVSDGNLWIYL
jgi:hypothetical protein